jgi:hypothetical protein
MKAYKFFSAISLAAGMLLLSSCGGSDENNTEAVNADSATNTSTTTQEMPDLLAVKHKVVDFAKWKTSFDMHDSARKAAGMHIYVVARGVEDSNMVMIVTKMDDTAKAKQFISNPDLKTAMQKSGAVGKPEISMLNVEWMDMDASTTEPRVLVTHKVKDWAAWKTAFDNHKQLRADNGLKEVMLGNSLDDPNMVSISFAITDATKARAFMASKELKDHMAKSGVEGMPNRFMYKIVQKY